MHNVCNWVYYSDLINKQAKYHAYIYRNVLVLALVIDYLFSIFRVFKKVVLYVNCTCSMLLFELPFLDSQYSVTFVSPNCNTIINMC